MPTKPKKRTKTLKAPPVAKKITRAKKPYDPYALTAWDIRMIKKAHAEYLAGNWIDVDTYRAERQLLRAKYGLE